MDAERMYAGEKLKPIHALVLHKMDGTKFELNAGGTGIDLNIDSPWATQAMLSGIWQNVNWHAYQPFTFERALIDPAVEIGDIVRHTSLAERIYTLEINYGKRVVATMGAPDWNELPHDYQPSASGSGGVGSAGRSRGGKDDIRFAQQQLVADLGDVQAGLYAIASADDIRGFKEARTTMFAKLDGETVKKASISLEVVKTGDVTKSLASILADQIKLEGMITIENGSNMYFRSGANLQVSGGNLYLTNGANLILGNGDQLTIAGTKYKPTNITFANGTFTVLAE